jgi:hypothetical protein
MVAAAFGAALSLVVAASPARAEMEVIESSAPGITEGETLPDDARLNLPKGSVVRVLVRTAKGTNTRTLKGPFTGTAAEYREKRNWLGRAFSPKAAKKSLPGAEQ